jgi:uncharacterized protein (DUF2236 family)
VTKFPADSAIRRITRSRAVLLYGPAALALQVADERVAAGVRDYSDFERDPVARLHRTLEASYAAVFARVETSDAAVARVDRLHTHVAGTTASGRPYAAKDPELLLWVMATLVACGIEAFQRFVHPLPHEDKAAYYDDMRVSTVRFSLPLAYGPQSYDEFVDYWQDRLADPTLGTSATSREVAAKIVAPRRPVFLRPGGVPLRWWTAETLPDGVRERLGFRRTAASRVAAATVDAVAKPLLRHGPESVRLVRAARLAERRERGDDAGQA